MTETNLAIGPRIYPWRLEKAWYRHKNSLDSSVDSILQSKIENRMTSMPAKANLIRVCN